MLLPTNWKAKGGGRPTVTFLRAGFNDNIICVTCSLTGSNLSTLHKEIASQEKSLFQNCYPRGCRSWERMLHKIISSLHYNERTMSNLSFFTLVRLLSANRLKTLWHRVLFLFALAKWNKLRQTIFRSVYKISETRHLSVLNFSILAVKRKDQ